MMSAEQVNTKTYQMVASWEEVPPSLSVETPKDAALTFTMVTDIVLAGITEPVRLPLSFKVGTAQSFVFLSF